MGFKKRSSLLSVLICLTLLSISAQLSLFIIHNHATELVDSLVGSSIPSHIFNVGVISPLLQFIVLQILAYILFIGFIWFISVSCGELFHLPIYELGIIFWVITSLAVLAFNSYLFPDSFFSGLLMNFPLKESLMWLSGSCLMIAVVCAYYHLLRYKRLRFLGAIFLTLAVMVLLSACLNFFSSQARYQALGTDFKPNIILIGLDSLRPDHTGFLGKAKVATPNIDLFLKTAVTFTDAYTPLARTFPAWVSILTGKHPKNSHARINLSYAQPVTANATVAKELQKIGYETIYATDEKRFSNITTDYGFDRVIGPGMGLGDFILGGLSDFPLTNLMINLPLGRFLFPYNYGNRAAAITYEPDKFLQLIKTSLHQRQGKPLFLAVHFCISHWPYTWARDFQNNKATMDQRYNSSVEKVDKQLGELLQTLKENGLLEHSVVVLLSDHGTTFGLPGERLIDKRHYKGDPAKLKWVTLNKLSTSTPSSLNLQQNYSLNTAYGQGTDVLSLKQYHVLLAFKYFNLAPFSLREAGGGSRVCSTVSKCWVPHSVPYRSSLLDIAPTLLGLLKQPPLKSIDGTSLEPYIFNYQKEKPVQRSFFLETGHSLSEIETNEIKVEKVLKKTIDLYQLNPKNGYVFVKPTAEKAIIEGKQRAVLLGDWILARYPASQRMKLTRSNLRSKAMENVNYLQPAYYVLANIKTGAWTIGLDTALAKQAPLSELQNYFKAFYGAELNA